MCFLTLPSKSRRVYPVGNDHPPEKEWRKRFIKYEWIESPEFLNFDSGVRDRAIKRVAKTWVSTSLLPVEFFQQWIIQKAE